jgi:hypothetical protein
MNPQEKAKSKPRARSRGAADQGQPGRDAAAAAAMSAQPAENDWHESASFQVSFEQMSDQAGQVIWRTQAYREETEARMVWPDVADEALVRWMRDKAGLPVEMPAAEPQATLSTEAPMAEASADLSAGAHATETPDDLRLDIGGIWIEEVPAEQQVSGPPIPKRLRARIDFQLSNTAAYLITAGQSCYAVQVLAYDLETGAAALSATDQQQLRPDLLAYSTTIDFDLPPLGCYQLLGMVLLPNDRAVGVTLGPVVTVVP